MDTNLPLPQKPRWFHTEVAGAAFAAAPSLVASTCAIVAGVVKHDRTPVVTGACVLVAGIFGLVIGIVRSRKKDERERAQKSAADLEGCLYILHAAILAMKGLAYDESNIAKLRVTIHRVIEHASKVRQLVPYVGGGGGGKDREMLSRCGIVGRAITRLKPQGMIREGSFDDYVRVMCEEYGMLVGEARELSDDRFSFLAIPLVNGRSAVGVVYLDSTEPDFFSDAAAPNAISPHMVAMISTSCGGLAPYTRLRYPE